MTNEPAQEAIDSAAELRDEAERYSRYLGGDPPGPGVVQRYVDACHKLLLDRPDGEDAALLDFVRKHPATLPALDAACGIVRPGALLRKKLFLMLALLETAPEHAGLFIATPRRLPAAAGRLALHGVSAALKILAGLVVYPLARGPR